MLDADVKKVLQLIANKNLPGYETMSPAAARAAFRAGAFSSQPPSPQIAQCMNLLAPRPQGQIAIRSYRPLGCELQQSLPALVFFHGGGFTFGDLDTHDVLCRELCNRSQAAVFSVDYRMGPEHTFPAAHDDAFAALQWIAEHAASLGIDAARIAVGGDSAGGNLAAACAILARDNAGPKLICQLLIYPVVDFRFTAASHRRNGDGYLLTSKLLSYFCKNYLNSDADRHDWRLSPLLAADLAGLPPAVMITAGYDPLVDEGYEYAERLRAAGNQADYVCYEGQVHGFITMGRHIAAAGEAIAFSARGLRQHWLTQPEPEKV